MAANKKPRAIAVGGDKHRHLHLVYFYAVDESLEDVDVIVQSYLQPDGRFCVRYRARYYGKDRANAEADFGKIVSKAPIDLQNPEHIEEVTNGWNNVLQEFLKMKSDLKLEQRLVTLDCTGQELEATLKQRGPFWAKLFELDF